MKVYIVQLKCPNNHCVMGLAGEFETDESANAALSYAIGEMMGNAVKEGLVNYECGICHSHQLRPQVAATRFTTMAEAKPHLDQAEKDQMASAIAIRAMQNGAKNN